MSVAVYFDLETGGVEPTRPDIQLAAIAVDEASGNELETFEAKITFDAATADTEALALNHYSPEAWTSAEHERIVAAKYASFLNRYRYLACLSKRTGKTFTVAKLVGHNAATFDGPRLRALFARHDLFLPADPRVRCTCQRALWWFDERAIVPKDYKLATLCEYFGIAVAESHEALADVRATVALARALQGRDR